MMIELEQGCPLWNCDWTTTVHTTHTGHVDDRPDEHDYLVLYQSVVEHLKDDHSATPGGPK